MRERRPPHKTRERTKPTDNAAAKRVTLPRALSKLGYCSRTQAERLIAENRVAVDGRIVNDTSAWVDLATARISIDGLVIAAEAKIYLMLNKPRGLVTTRHDPEGRPTVYDCLRDFDIPHLSPVGRLDKASEGLLLFTNDTEFAQILLDPVTHVTKTYHVQIDRIMDDEDIAAMTSGIRHDGELLTATAARRLRHGDRNSWIEVELDEGRNRQIRRMLEALGTECLRLVRVAIGGLELGELPKGAVRALSEPELQALRRKTGMERTRRN
ncbi:pseudouridine synthase [Rhizobium johnstonii]|uniref:Pseudouridine synthase n=2 Tax=Rhizobium TaxID=379 RepID=Q1MCH2_RHIJ3|nr:MULTISPECIES: pseudouridine synthase [Rhizobium]MBB4507291.1 23S rRNA pseudouridine2605 synthase [Rhizobium leguminosarum]MBY5321895.1 rRNA pseudouridine synthase [Rhizobium leguminosarum]MBY5375093.1 rRNA pseudouridine synthase [Rhizobium leguminosarum]MBY5382825.1 rRNA pseudouridine synthase [Rhizobium leguminosarum]MBY5389764.1 rRNA pseudouridine synthase [Rhizobium leguminosarum]